MGKMIKRHKKYNALTIVLGVILLIYCLILLWLLLWAFSTSVKSNVRGGANAFLSNKVGLPKGSPLDWKWSNYVTIFNAMKVPIGDGKFATIIDMLINTMLYTVGGAIISTFVPCIVAYVAAKMKFKFNAVLDFIVIVTMIIPIVGSYPSEIQILKQLNIYDSWAAMFIQKFNFLGVYYLIFEASFSTLPDAYIEAARIEGANEYCILFKVMLPLVKTIIFTVFLILFIALWNDYSYALLYFPSKPTLAYGVYVNVLTSMAAENAINGTPFRMAGSLMLCIPVLILFSFLSNALMQNLSLGGLKE